MSAERQTYLATTRNGPRNARTEPSRPAIDYSDTMGLLLARPGEKWTNSSIALLFTDRNGNLSYSEIASLLVQLGVANYVGKPRVQQALRNAQVYQTVRNKKGAIAPLSIMLFAQLVHRATTEGGRLEAALEKFFPDITIDSTVLHTIKNLSVRLPNKRSASETEVGTLALDVVGSPPSVADAASLYLSILDRVGAEERLNILVFPSEVPRRNLTNSRIVPYWRGLRIYAATESARRAFEAAAALVLPESGADYTLWAPAGDFVGREPILTAARNVGLLKIGRAHV